MDVLAEIERAGIANKEDDWSEAYESSRRNAKQIERMKAKSRRTATRQKEMALEGER